MSLINFSIRKPLLVNLLLALVALAGLFAWQSMPQEMFPMVELDKVRISTEFAGAAPEEVERQITIPIEQAFDGMADIDTITSTSSEGFSTVMIDLKQGSNIDQFIRDADATLDRITELPEEAEQPELVRLQTRFPVISMALYGNLSSGELYAHADQVRDQLLQIPGVASVGEAGSREPELWVLADPQAMATLGVTLDQISDALRRNLRDLPGGTLIADEGEMLLRGRGVSPEPEAVAGIVLRSNVQGGQLTLGQVAAVERRFERAITRGRFNGQPSVNLTINKSSDASTIEIADRVRELAARLPERLPPTLSVGLFSDLSVYIKNRLDTVKSSGLIGLILVLISLYLFLNFRVALVTALGIPVSFLIAVVLIQQWGFTINMVSLFAFLIALGMVVDDAIIVNENIFRHIEQGMAPAEAARVGAREVLWPVIASTATTIAAFLPMFAIGGTLGAFTSVIPAVVTAALLGSLLEAFGVLPSHAAELLRPLPPRPQSGRWQRWLARYQRLLHWTLINRYFTALAGVGVLLLVLLLAATRVPFQLFGNVHVGQFFINIDAPITYSLDESARLAVDLEAAINEELGEAELASLLTNVGVTFVNFNSVVFASNRIQLIVDLQPEKPRGVIERWISPLMNLQLQPATGSRERDTRSVIDALRLRLRQLPGVERLVILQPQGGPQGADIEIGISGPEPRQLRRLADEVAGYLARVPGARDVRHDTESGKLELRYTLNERGRQLGLTQATLAAAVRAGFQGLEPLQVTWGEKRIPVRILYPDALREDARALEQLRLALPEGGAVYLSEVADLTLGRALAAVHRHNQQRQVTITGEVDDEVTTPLQVTAQLRQQFANFAADHPNYQISFEGEQRESRETVSDLLRALVIALACIFLILAALFNSLLDPFVVMLAIPFATIGVVLGHLLFGFNIQFLSLIGFVALAGIVVNDSLILIDFSNRRRAAGSDRISAMVEAGGVRARPILLTSVTTFLGVSPLIFFATGQTAFLAPMAVSLGFGLLGATVVILLVLPSCYLILDDVRQRWWRRG